MHFDIKKISVITVFKNPKITYPSIDLFYYNVRRLLSFFLAPSSYEEERKYYTHQDQECTR